MEGQFNFSRAQNGSGCWQGKIVNKIGAARGGARILFAGEVSQGRFYSGMNPLINDGNEI